jgi:hypothetical protein
MLYKQALGWNSAETSNVLSVLDSPEVQLVGEISDALQKKFGISNGDERFHFLMQGYMDAMRGNKCDLWQVRRMGHEFFSDRDKREEWIELNQKLYEQAYDFSLAQHFPLRDKEYVRIAKWK